MVVLYFACSYIVGLEGSREAELSRERSVELKEEGFEARRFHIVMMASVKP
jgi:hypothetical protein